MVRDGAAGAGSAGRVPLSVSSAVTGHRRAALQPRAVAEFGAHAEPALDALELFELAWAARPGAAPASDQVVEDLLLLAGGDLARLVLASRLALSDPRGVQDTAQHVRAR